jgi:hypothetical protein
VRDQEETISGFPKPHPDADRHASNDLAFPMPCAASQLCPCIGRKLPAVGLLALCGASRMPNRTCERRTRVDLVWGFAYMTVYPLANSAPLNALDSLSLPSTLYTFPIAQITKRRLLRGFDKCGSDTSEAEPQAFAKLSLPTFRRLLDEWCLEHRCFHES